MKKYLRFIKEEAEDKLIDVKNDIADKIATETTKEDSVDKMDIEEKPNEDIQKNMEDMIEGFEKRKSLLDKSIQEVNNKIEFFKGQLDIEKESGNPNPDKIKEVEELIKKYETDLDSFDLQIKDAEGLKDKISTTK